MNIHQPLRLSNNQLDMAEADSSPLSLPVHPPLPHQLRNLSHRLLGQHVSFPNRAFGRPTPPSPSTAKSPTHTFPPVPSPRALARQNSRHRARRHVYPNLTSDLRVVGDLDGVPMRGDRRVRVHDVADREEHRVSVAGEESDGIHRGMRGGVKMALKVRNGCEVDEGCVGGWECRGRSGGLSCRPEEDAHFHTPKSLAVSSPGLAFTSGATGLPKMVLHTQTLYSLRWRCQGFTG